MMMMTRNLTASAQEPIHSLFERYMALDYRDRLACYNEWFGLIPFSFPDFDTRISWFTDEDKLHRLSDNFYHEIRSHHLLETVREEGGEQFIFTVKPASLIQRIQYNKFLFSRFIITDEVIRKSIASELNKAADKVIFLQAKIHAIYSTLTWVKNILQNKKTKFNLQNQFLKVVYSGITGYGSAHGISDIRNRRKFVEAYLYAQGIYIAAHLHWLQHFLEESKKP